MEEEKDFLYGQWSPHRHEKIERKRRKEAACFLKVEKMKVSKFFLFLGVSMALVSAGVWLYFLTCFFINPDSFIIIEEKNRLISGIEILLQANAIIVLIYFLIKKL